MFKKVVFLLLIMFSVTSFADSTKVKPSLVIPKSNLLLRTKTNVLIQDKTLRDLDTFAGCPSHLTPMITTSLASIVPITGCNTSANKTCFMSEIEINVYLETSNNQIKVKSNNSYASVVSKDGTISATTPIYVNYVVTCVN